MPNPRTRPARPAPPARLRDLDQSDVDRDGEAAAEAAHANGTCNCPINGGVRIFLDCDSVGHDEAVDEHGYCPVCQH
jgi:hypothetical protein